MYCKYHEVSDAMYRPYKIGSGTSNIVDIRFTDTIHLIFANFWKHKLSTDININTNFKILNLGKRRFNNMNVRLIHDTDTTVMTYHKHKASDMKLSKLHPDARKRYKCVYVI